MTSKLRSAVSPATPTVDTRGRRLTRFLRAAVLAIAAVLLAWPLSVSSGVVAAALGAGAGALLGDLMARGRLRTSSAVVLGLVAVLFGVLVVQILGGSAWVARLLGPIATLHLLEILRWLLLPLPFFATLRLLAARRPGMAVVEAMVVGGAVVLTLAAHRDGMVHRPHAVGDWAWSRGLDPVLPLLALGGLGVLLLAALLVREERRKRLPLHFAALAAVALLFLAIVRVGGLPKPSAGDLGLTGDPQEEQEGEGGEGSEGGRSEGDPRDELDNLEFQDEYESNGQQAPVAVVVLHDDYSPPSGVYYLRQSVFSQYNGRRLIRATRDDVDRDIVPHFPSRIYEVREVPERGDRRPLRTTIGLMVDHIRPFALDAPTHLEPTTNPSPMRIRRAYEAVSQVPEASYESLLGRRPGSPDWTNTQWDHYTTAPSDPRYTDVAEQIIAEVLRPEFHDDALAQAMAIKTFLDQNGIYSRKSTHAGADDPAASFLFGDLTGYCVHFAHAAAYLFRTRGIPSRVASGYAVAESDRGTSSTVVVSGGNAHAWPEIYLEDIGWVTIDPAPQQTLDEPTGPPDPQLQRMLGEMMRPEFKEEQGFDDQIQQPFDWAALMQRLMWLLAALVLAGYAVKLYRALVPSLASPGQLYRLGYRAALDRMAEVGWQRRFGESREAFAERAARLVPAFHDLTREHLRWALGSRRMVSPEQVAQMRVEMRRQLGERVPWWRRTLGVVDPFSWLRVR